MKHLPATTPDIPRRIEEEGILFKNPSEMKVDFRTVDQIVVRILDLSDPEYSASCLVLFFVNAPNLAID
jgi:hypothetical protein